MISIGHKKIDIFKDPWIVEYIIHALQVCNCVIEYMNTLDRYMNINYVSSVIF